MKELLKELGFEHLPMLSEFVKKRGSTIVDGGATFHENAQLILEKINAYTDFITQPLTDETCKLFKNEVELLHLIWKYETIEQAINNGVKLIMK